MGRVLVWQRAFGAALAIKISLMPGSLCLFIQIRYQLFPPILLELSINSISIAELRAAAPMSGDSGDLATGTGRSVLWIRMIELGLALFTMSLTRTVRSLITRLLEQLGESDTPICYRSVIAVILLSNMGQSDLFAPTIFSGF